MITPNKDAAAAADDLANRLSDPDAKVPAGRGRQRPQSLAGGAAGISLLHAERAYHGHAAWSVAHTWLSRAAHDELSLGHNASLFFGAPTLAFVTQAAAHNGRYARALDNLDRRTTELTGRRLTQAHRRIDRGARPVMAEFDLIRGLAGLGAYHLHRYTHTHTHDNGTVRAVLSYLVRLTEPLPLGDDLPGWWTDVSPNGEPSPDFPDGHGNLGMAHGIAAPLALLAGAARQGITVDGQTEAISRICAWLDDWQQTNAAGSWWPGFLTRQQIRDRRTAQVHPHRPSWCYGAPGIARAQQLAGVALGDLERQHRAETTMLGCLRDPAQLDLLTEIGLCHGLAGTLQITCRMATDAATPALGAELPHLINRILDRLHAATDDPEFLDGLAGVALALHTAGTGRLPVSDWDLCLLLA